ncbi:MAG: HEAT repeat domain-containing protein, partial [Planctomycetia bacterium]|nr:HEAT repeat domain-containing protein [Planctomycetia bacterium]
VRWRAAEALGKIGDRRAVGPLIDLLKDKSYHVREAAAKSLWKITQKKFGEDQAKWLQWWKKNKVEYQMGKTEKDKPK